EIFSFLGCKTDTGKHWTTNISVEVDDDFWAAVDAGEPHAADVLMLMADGMLRDGEPGFWDSALSNRGEPNEVIATNPCGEIALEAWENCNLGHINLAAFVLPNGDTDWQGMVRAHEL